MCEYKKLTEICSPKQWKTISQKDMTQDGYPVYGANGIIGYYNKYNHEKPTVMVTCRGATCGVINISKPFSWINGNAMSLDNVSNDVIEKYLYYYLKNRGLRDVISGSAQPQITIQNLSKIKVLCPNIEEQQRIVKILDKAEEIRTKKKLANEKLDEFLKSTFIDMFGDPVINSNKYKVHKLEKYIKVIGGYAFKSKLFKEDGIPVLRIGNINTGILKLDNVVYWDYDETLQKYMLYPNDLVISLTGTVGKDDYGNVCILPKTCNCYYLNQRNAKLDVNKEMDKYYLCYLLRNKDIKSRLTGISRGVRQANIANSDILNLLVPIPPIDLQKQFAPIVQKVEAQKEKNQKVIEQMDNLFNSLMQQAFNYK